MGDDTGRRNRLRADFINDCCSLLPRPSAAAAPLRSANRRTNETLDDGEEDETDDDGRVGVGNSAPDPAQWSQARPRPRSRPLSPRPFALRAARSPRSWACPSMSLPPSLGLSVSLCCERALGPLIAVRGTSSMRATAKLSCSAAVPRSVRARQGPGSGRLRRGGDTPGASSSATRRRPAAVPMDDGVKQ